LVKCDLNVFRLAQVVLQVVQLRLGLQELLNDGQVSLLCLEMSLNQVTLKFWTAVFCT